MIDTKNHNFNNSKLKNGFSLIESLVALLIISIFVGTLFKFQGNIFRSTNLSHKVMEQTTGIKNLFVQANQEELYKTNKSKEVYDDKTKTNYIYKIEKIPEKSQLTKIKNLVFEKVKASSKNKTLELKEEVFINLKYIY